MSYKVDSLFPTFFYRGHLTRSQKWNVALATEVASLEQIDRHGQVWSRSHFSGGYSSYSSYFRLHQTSPNLAELEKRLRPHVNRYIKALNWDLMRRKIEMTTCWANSMGSATYHTLHTHPGSVISGVYYVKVPKEASPFKIEDPRLPLFMAAPPRQRQAPKAQQNYLQLQAQEGEFYLFESWLRHEVPPHRSDERRVSISFNYEWI